MGDEEPGDSGAFADKAQPGENEAPSTVKCTDQALEQMNESQQERFKADLLEEVSKLNDTFQALVTLRGQGSELSLALSQKKNIQSDKSQLEEKIQNDQQELDALKGKVTTMRLAYQDESRKFREKSDKIKGEQTLFESLEVPSEAEIEMLQAQVNELNQKIAEGNEKELGYVSHRDKLNDCLSRLNTLLQKRKKQKQINNQIKAKQREFEEKERQQMEAMQKKFQEQLRERREQHERELAALALQGEFDVDMGNEGAEDSETESPSVL